MLSIAKPFVIWALYPALVDHLGDDYLRATLICLGITVVISFNNLRRCFVIDLTVVVYFLSVLVLELTQSGAWILAYPMVVISSLYTLMSAGSLLIRKPYTLQYARQRTPETFWSEKSFIAINNHLTGIWTAIFFLCFILSSLAVIFPTHWPIFVIARNSLIAVGLVIPDQYPDYYLRRKATEIA